MAATDLLELSSSDRETLATWLVEFDTAWREDALATWVTDKLPKLEPRLRRAALAELVKVDLEQQWTRGRRLTLGSYLERFPDLGTAQTVAADLIFAEYQVRQQFGEPGDLTELARRYPRQAAELSRLIHGDLGVQSLAPLSFEPPPVAAPDRDTSQLRAATDTAVQAARGEAPDANARHGTPDPAEPPASEAPRELPKKFGRYSILKKLGKGGMGAVYLAYDTQLERRVALKVPNFSAQEQREVVHANGIVHRDLKPQNIFIDQRGEPVVVDFGLARRGVSRDATLTQSGALMGTPAYMAPEQARGRIEAVGPHSDVYSLGVILYQLLTGRLPFQGDFLAVLGQVMSADAPDPPSKHQPELDPQLEAICLKAMAKRPEDRYASMADFAQALTELLKSGQLAGHPRRGSPDVVGRGSPDPALAADRQVSPTADEPAWPSAPTLMDAQGVSGRPAVAKVARSGDRPQPAPGDRPQPAPGDRPQPAPGDRPQPKPVERLQRMPRVPRRLWIATACGGAAVLLGIILYVQTNHGFVKIELSDPAAKVQVQVDGETIAITGLDRPLRLQPGEHGLVVTGDDFETVTRSFTVKRGSDEPLRITLVPKAEQVAQTPTPLVEPPASQPAVYRVCRNTNK